jgi:hypothetical protein
MAKKISIFFIIITLIAIGYTQVFAADREGPIEASVFVKQIFDLSVKPISLDFGEVESSAKAIKSLTISCQTNNNNQWELSIVLQSPLTSGTFIIPNENFRWEKESSIGSGRWNVGRGYVDTTPYTFYSSGNDEYITPTGSPINFNLRFYVDVPMSQASGVYSTVMEVKMKDTITNQEVLAYLDVSVNVRARFALSVSSGGGGSVSGGGGYGRLSVSTSSLIFGKVEPGRTTERKELYITCSTNNNNPWSVSIHAISELTSESYTIPNDNFRWYDSQGVVRSMVTTPYTFYVSSPDEYITTLPVELCLGFEVNVPPTQPPGRYTTTLLLTMTETGAPIPPR